MNIYADKTIELARTFRKGKGAVDTTGSGNFKGKLKPAEYEVLMGLVRKIDWDRLSFPKMNCCDGPLRTIILSYNDRQSKNKSMSPSKEAMPLINFLTKLGEEISLPVFDKPIDFEEILE